MTSPGTMGMGKTLSEAQVSGQPNAGSWPLFPESRPSATRNQQGCGGTGAELGEASAAASEPRSCPSLPPKSGTPMSQHLALFHFASQLNVRGEVLGSIHYVEREGHG